MRSQTFARLSLVATAASMCALVGCTSSDGGNDGGRYSDISGDVTPELKSQHQRSVEMHSEIAATWNNNHRMKWADLHRLMLNDRPSLLTTMPQPY